MKKFYSTFDIARLCQVSPASVNRWIKEGKLASAVTPGGHHRVRLEDVIQLLRSLGVSIPPELEPPQRVLLILSADASMREMLRSQVLARYPDRLVLVTDDLFAAGWMACEFKPDVLVVDFEPLASTRQEVLTFLHRYPGLEKIRILALLPGGGTRREIVCDAYLEKPFEMEAFLQEVAVLLGEGSKKVREERRAAGA